MGRKSIKRLRPIKPDNRVKEAWKPRMVEGCPRRGIAQKLIDQDKAFDNFFKGRAKFPKFKKKSHAQSVR